MSEVSVLDIPAAGSLDGVTVFWQNYSEGKGSVTFTCWGSAWTVYFGGMGPHTIQEFFASAGTDYLVNKLGNTQWLKSSKAHEKYLGLICDAIKATLKVAPTESEATK